MASVKAIQRYHLRKDGTKQIFIRISHKGINRYISTGIYVQPKFFKNGHVTKNRLGWATMNRKLNERINHYLDLISQFSSSRSFSVHDLLNKDKLNVSDDFFVFAESYNERFLITDSPNSYRRHKTIIKKLHDYWGGRLQFHEINHEFLNSYIKHLFSLGNGPNTINGNIKFIRTVWNTAYKQEKHDVHRSPFSAIKIPRKKVSKLALSIEEIDALRNTNISGSLDILSKDLFLASFFLGGIRFADICTLQIDNIQNGYLYYVMNKTGRQMRIPLVGQVLELIDKYSNRNSKLLFPLLRDEALQFKKERLFQAISSKNAVINKSLKRVASACGIEKHITFHIARHSFAEVSRKSNVSIYDISKMMGHSSINITESYLSALDSESMDAAFAKMFEQH